MILPKAFSIFPHAIPSMLVLILEFVASWFHSVCHNSRPHIFFQTWEKEEKEGQGESSHASLPLFKSRGKFFLRISLRISFLPLSILITRTESYAAYILAAEEVCLVTLWHFQFLMQSDTAGKEERERKWQLPGKTAMATLADYFQRSLSAKVQILWHLSHRVVSVLYISQHINTLRPDLSKSTWIFRKPNVASFNFFIK